MSAGTTYYYTITQVNPDGTETPIVVSAAAATLTSDSASPQQPTDFTIQWTNPMDAMLFWTDSGTNTTEDVIRQSDDNGATWQVVDIVPTHSESDTISNLTPGASYEFSVTADNSTSPAAAMGGKSNSPGGGQQANSTGPNWSNYSAMVFVYGGFLQTQSWLNNGYKTGNPNDGIGALANHLFNDYPDLAIFLIATFSYNPFSFITDTAVTGAEAAFDSAMRSGFVTDYAMIGYSHGGGAVYDLSVLCAQDILQNNWWYADFFYSAYIDAVQKSPYRDDIDRKPVVRRPDYSDFNDNFYENQSSFIHGAQMQDILQQDPYYEPITETDGGDPITHQLIGRQASIYDNIEYDFGIQFDFDIWINSGPIY